MEFELSNEQRVYFGLEPIGANWEKVSLKGDTYRKESILYFDGDVLKRHLFPYSNSYKEIQYNEITRERQYLMPKTSKGKERKITASVLESITPVGVYLSIDQYLLIGNHTTQTTFYSGYWEKSDTEKNENVPQKVNEFITASDANHLQEILAFKNAKRKNIKYKTGDIFAFKLNRNEYGFGRILLDIDKLRKKNLLPEQHGFHSILGTALLINVYAFTSKSKSIDIQELSDRPLLPSQYIMDNHLFYGEYEIIGHTEIKEEELEFPISYGSNLKRYSETVLLQWGIINLEKPSNLSHKYLQSDTKPNFENPYGHHGIGFNIIYTKNDILATAKNGFFSFDSHQHFKSKFDLRNPKNNYIRREIFEVFGLNPDLGYIENCRLTNTPPTIKI